MTHQELQQLTGMVSPQVLEALKGLVTVVLAGIVKGNKGDGNPTNNNQKNSGIAMIAEQYGGAHMHLCM